MENVINGKLNEELGLEILGSLDLGGTNISELPDNLSVGGYLYLRGTNISELPDNLSVGGSLDLGGTNISELPDNLSVGGYLDLGGTNISELPDNLSVGGSLYLGGTNISDYPVVYNCGDEDRAIYLDLKDKSIIRIGCFKGTKEEAISAVENRYSGDSMKKYISQIGECFKKGSE